MSVLQRYRKAGGFAQLLMLIESSDLKKQESLLKVVEKEDPSWAALVKAKMLTVDKIMAWPVEAIAEVTSRLPEKVMAFALHGMKPGDREKAMKTFGHSKIRMITEQFEGSKPTSGEIFAAIMRMIMEVRKLEKEGTLKVHKFDQSSALNDPKVA